MEVMPFKPKMPLSQLEVTYFNNKMPLSPPEVTLKNQNAIIPTGSGIFLK
jgi:hypothetical protein